MRIRFTYLLLILIVAVAPLQAKKAKDGTKYKPIADPPTGYVHDKWKTLPRDQMFEFHTFTTSFDGADDSDGDGDTEDNDKLGIPEWVAFEVRKQTVKIKAGSSPWKSEETLNMAGMSSVAPRDASYHHAKAVQEAFPVSLTYNLSRGHMCPRNIAKRLSADATANTFTVLNACPQYQWFNNGIWKDLERLTENYADHHGKVWVICGPVFLQKRPRLWLGELGEKPVAVPDGFFKIIVRESDDSVKPHVLAFLYPHAIKPSDNRKAGGQFPHEEFLTSVDDIEKHTGLDFFTALTIDQQTAIEKKKSVIWEDPGTFELP